MHPYIKRMFTSEERERYARHILLKEIGGAGQQRLRAAHVALVGLGGLGAPAALYLAAAGVGRLTLIDHDAVGLSNLQRQVLYASEDVGAPKAERAAARLAALNPHVEAIPRPMRLEAANAAALLAGADVVLDGSDSFDTRFLVNAAAVATKTPLVSGAVGRWEGQVGVFAGRPCYRCFVPHAPPEAEPCAAAGIVGALTGVIGAMMALEAIKLIARAGESLAGRLLFYDALNAATRVARLPPDPACDVCGGLHA